MSGQTFSQIANQIVAGTNITISSTGAISGTGVVTINATGGGGGGITSINGDTTAAQTLVTGSAGTDFTISTVLGVSTFDIPSASASNRGLVTTGTQTLAGAKTLSSDLTLGANLVSSSATFLIHSDTNGKETFIAGGLTASAGDGAYIRIGGDTSASHGTLYLFAGTDSPFNDASVEIAATSTTGEVRFNTQSILRIVVDANGHLVPNVTATYDLGTVAKRFGTLYVQNVGNNIDFTNHAITGLNDLTSTNNAFQILADSNLNYTQIGGGTSPVSANGAWIGIGGDTSAVHGTLYLQGGTDSVFNSASVEIAANSTTGEVRITTQVILRWAFDANGHLVPHLDNTYDIGNGTFLVRRGYFRNLDHAGFGLNIETSGTTKFTFIGDTLLPANDKVQSIGSISQRLLNLTSKVLTVKAEDNYTGAASIVSTSAVDTTNATPTNLGTVTLLDDTTYKFRVDVIGRFNSTTAKNIWGSLEFGVRRNNGSVATLIGLRLKELDTEGSPTYDFEVSVSGNDVIILVTGAIGETVSWQGQFIYSSVSTAA